MGILFYTWRCYLPKKDSMAMVSLLAPIFDGNLMVELEPAVVTTLGKVLL